MCVCVLDHMNTSIHHSWSVSLHTEKDQEKQRSKTFMEGMKGKSIPGLINSRKCENPGENRAQCTERIHVVKRAIL